MLSDTDFTFDTPPTDADLYELELDAEEAAYYEEMAARAEYFFGHSVAVGREELPAVETRRAA